MLYQLGRYEEALACLDAILDVDGADLTARATRALLLESLGRREAARQDLERLLLGSSLQSGGQMDALSIFAQVGLEVTRD